MDHFLRSQELVSNVVSKLLGLGLEPSTKDLAVLARACKAFKNPALDALWRKQHNLMNLVKCMPIGVWEAVDVDGIMTLKRSRELVASDWERVLEHSGRVKLLICQDPVQEEDANDPSLLEVYATLSGGGAPDCLLRNLQRLSWHHHQIPFFSIFHLLLGPKLSFIDLPSLSADPSLFNPLAGRFLHLVSLTIPVPHHGHLSTIMLKHVGRLETFEAIEFVLDNAIMLAGITDSSLFSHLRAAKLEAYEISHLVAFVCTWNSPQLRSFSAEILNSLEVAGLEGLYQGLVAHCAHAQLYKVEVNFVYSYFLECYASAEDPQTPTSIHRGHFFRQLYVFTHLKEVDIGVPFGYDIDDRNISDMAQAWPNLEKLVLGSYSSYQPECTLLSLSALGKYCPCLSVAEITLDASNVPALPIAPAQQLIHDKLISFDAAFSQILDPPAVATFISSIFCNLRGVQSSLEAADNRLRWMAVNQILQS
ncbi:hypothetical protein DFH08DRAFT_1073721 [Mycena albidolilacea]|uniref:Uncharacterized protein n=1 Tax=Mycena albidolilacea TaxID=1033008 RepID=A0AAD7F3C3_9AGAR|nr:hypothetical protein DFH08DRAFT_1073721 [Mycena albidolilacea]